MADAAPYAPYSLTSAGARTYYDSAVATVTLTPGAHGTDALYVYGVWVEYTRLLT